MNRKLFALVSGVLFSMTTVAQAAVYDNVYWVGGSGEWTGDVTASPEYATGHWSASPTGPGLPAKYVLGRNDGIRVGEAVGNGGYDLDRVPCGGSFSCTGTTGAGTQLGTDIYISGPVTVSYNPNRQFLSGDDGLDRFGDFRIQPNSAFPGTPTMNLSNGATWEQTTAAGGDADGMWTRAWNGAELNIDNATFRRTGDETQGFASGAMMFASFHGYDNSVQTISLTNGGRIENEGALWIGLSGTNVGGDNHAGIRVVTTINNGHIDLTGGDEFEMDNDGLPMRADLAFIFDWKADADPTNDEVLVINFTGPGDITVDGQSATPLDVPAVGAGRGGIRVATNTALTGTNDYGNDGNIQRSYQDLWNMGLLTAQPNLSLPAKSGLTGDNFATYFATTNNPGDNNYKLTSLMAAPAANGKVKGDYNNNGTVDAADYVIYRDTLGSTTDLRADGNGSLNIDAADLVHWRNNFGTTGLPTFGSGAVLGAAVPEPGAALLMIVGLASLWVFKRR